jgi:hypothetical protein
MDADEFILSGFLAGCMCGVRGGFSLHVQLLECIENEITSDSTIARDRQLWPPPCVVWWNTAGAPVNMEPSWPNWGAGRDIATVNHKQQLNSRS